MTTREAFEAWAVRSGFAYRNHQGFWFYRNGGDGLFEAFAGGIEHAVPAQPQAAPAGVPEGLHLKVRGVALWIRSLRGQSLAVADSAFDTLMLAADQLASAPQAPAPAGDEA